MIGLFILIQKNRIQKAERKRSLIGNEASSKTMHAMIEEKRHEQKEGIN